MVDILSQGAFLQLASRQYLSVLACSVGFMGSFVCNFLGEVLIWEASLEECQICAPSETFCSCRRIRSNHHSQQLLAHDSVQCPKRPSHPLSEAGRMSFQREQQPSPQEERKHSAVRHSIVESPAEASR